MTMLSSLPNLGPILIKELHKINIRNAEQLRNMGSKPAFLEIKRNDPSACLSKLYALEGAVQGIRWHTLPEERKKELKDYFSQCSQK